MIDKNSIENLKSRLDIVDVIGNYIELKKSGANYKARCPFHNEETPSFVVSPAKQIYHCFGCGAGGDAISFVMEYDKLSYPEALEKLANDFNIPLIYTKNNFDKKDERKVLEQINIFYKRCFNDKEKAKSYLIDRGVYNSSREKFEIGYAPSSEQVISFLKENFLSEEDSVKTGILGVGEQGRIYARLVNRITFPIFSPNGKIVGFGGRTISNHPAKYINSPQTPFFNKSKLLYGYHLARENILRKNRIIITEGYLDVIMLHQAGFNESVATLGTALTKEHLPLLRRGEPQIVLSYDGDSAGISAALKASKMLSSLSMNGGVVIFDGGQDPADMVKSGKIDELNSLFNRPKPFIPFVLEKIANNYDLSNPLQKEKALNEAVDFIKTLSNVLQDEYKEYLSVLLQVDKRVIRIRKKYISKQNNIGKKEDLAELSIIKTILLKPQFLDMVLDFVDETVFSTHKEIFLKLIHEESDDSLFSGILIRDDIKELGEKELKSQLCYLLLGHYKIELESIKKREDLDFEKKSFYIRKIQYNLQKLKKGELVSYEKI